MMTIASGFESPSVIATHSHAGPMIRRQTAQSNSCLTIPPQDEAEQNHWSEQPPRFSAQCWSTVPTRLSRFIVTVDGCRSVLSFGGDMNTHQVTLNGQAVAVVAHHFRLLTMV